MKFKAIKPVGMLVTAATAMSLVSCGSKQQQQMQMPAPQIATITVGYGTSDVESGYPATLKGKTDIDIRPQVTGFITKVCVDEGQQVHKGQVLFQLDPVQFQAAVESAEAQVRLAETSLATAQLTADNKRKLFDKNIISEYEWQLAANSLVQAKSQLSAAKAQLVSAKKNLAYTVVTAPSNGVIGSIPNREGSLASPSSAQPLTTVSDNSQIYAYFSLNEKDILKLAQNGAKSLNSSVSQMPEVSLRLANGEIYPEKGKVATVSGVIDNTTGAATVRALFENKSGMLRSGSTGMVLIPQSTDSVLLIPQKATFEMQDRKFVYVVNDSNIVSTQPITVSPVTDGKNFVVLSGLQPGQRIAVEGIGTKVRDGITIVPTDPSAAQQPAAQPQK
ncbi:efflux RND transporter periplasmic adaptor subunit [Muribaculum sp.]|jgi:membrane fusion protein (multidrug efflux system)|uniref:efflux RND transporter periplasmic adaptor subunit n=4 Tax=Muribaculum TaxID=1918540 RepID=UPI00257EB092|nr:efflux RND transporter periplasmic adaptor subunit [Muribaculum sp.]